MVDYSQVLLLIMRPFKSLSIIAFLIINFVTSETFAQSFGLKIISVSDSSVITKDLQIFDSLWFKCMSDYGRNDVSPLFADHHPGVSKSNPITLLNFISGFDIPFSNMFGFRLIYNQNLNDTVNLYQLDMGWMQLAILSIKSFYRGFLSRSTCMSFFTLPFRLSATISWERASPVCTAESVQQLTKKTFQVF